MTSPRLGGPVAAVVAVFTISRLAAYASGVRFDASPLLTYAWHTIDRDLLRHRLLESLFYLHSQPPGFNAMLGAALKAFPDRPEVALHAVYVVFGLVHAIALLLVLYRAVGLGRWTSAAVTSVLSVSPAWITYENWLFYDYPAAALLTLSALLLFGFVDRRGWVAGLAFFAVVASLIATRAVFTPLWLVLVVGLLLLVCRDLRGRVLLTCTVAVAATAFLVGKNIVLFGVPSTSSWAGMNLAEVAFSQVPPDERRELVAQGAISKISLIEPFGWPGEYLGIVPRPRPRGVPLLDRLGTEAEPNLHSEIMVGASKQYFRDAVRLIRLRPEAYATAVALSLGLYARPSSDLVYVTDNRFRLGVFARAYDRVVLLQTKPGEPSWTIVLGHTLALLYGLWLTTRLLLRRAPPTARAVLLAYVWLTLAYATVLIGLVQISENQRLRFLVDTFAVILVAAAFRDAVAWTRNRRARQSEGAAHAGGAGDEIPCT